MSNLAKRLIFAFTAMPVVALLLWFSDYTRWGFVLFLNAVAAYEWAKMVSVGCGEKNRLMGVLSPVCTAALTLTWIVKIDMLLVLSSIILLYVIVAFVCIDIKNLFPWFALQMLAPLYLGLWGGMCLGLFDPGQGWWQCSKFLVVMTILWACDSAAYFAGKYLGKHKMSPQISPKKTWEGAVGGTLYAIFWFWIWSGAGFGVDVFKFSLLQAIIFALAVSAAGQLGDLLMSALKRWSGIKDSGGIFPGHGGVLDRADSFYFAVPIAVIFLSYLPK